MDNLIGLKFGRWTVLEKAESDHKWRTQWLCRCDCGTEKVVNEYSFKSGNTKSCGCLKKENMSKRVAKHGEANTRLYSIWNSMRTRCSNPNVKEYKNYGGRGITVQKSWLDYNNFKVWAFDNGYDEKAERGHCTLERKNCDLGYNESNCCFVSFKQQQNNRTNNHFVEYNGETKTLKQWCEQLNLNYNTIFSRIDTLKWSYEKAFTTPIRMRRKIK